MIRHQPQTQTPPSVPPEANAVLPFVTNCRRNALEQLQRAFTEIRPLVIMIGEGKSAASCVIRNFLDDAGDGVTVARVTALDSDAAGEMPAIIRAIGIDPKNMSAGELDDVFTMFLSLQLVRHRRTIICIDEPRDSDASVLDRVQHLVKLEREGKYGLMVILSGRPSLNEALKEHPLNSLAADVAERIVIPPFTRDETQEFIQWRGQAADSSGVDQLFEGDAIALLHQISRGVPDVVNKLYDRCLHLANKQDSTVVTAAVVKTAAKLLRQGRIMQLADVQARTVNGNGASRLCGRLIARMNDEIVQAQVHRLSHILIGRSRMCDLRLLPHDVSRHHAIVVNSSNGTDLLDLNSTNGTFVDGRSIKRYPLRDNDVITIGECMIRYISDED